ncbi:MAG: nucleotidyltransferase domain-containing protein [Nitrososphaeraceae archaeon]
MLESLFTSKARVSILEIFLLNKEKEFHIRELARILDISPPYIRKEFNNLKRLGILSERKASRNMIFYKINKSSSIVEDLKRIFLKTEGIAAELTSVLTKNNNKDNKNIIKYAMIYGSFAKGTEITSSDIDLLIIGSIDEDTLLKLVIDTQNKIGREINYTMWTEKEFISNIQKQIPLLREIRKTSVIMIIGDKDEFKRIIKEKIN